MDIPLLLWIIALVLLSGIVGFVVGYNRLVRFRNRMREGWSGIEVQLKRRHDLIPNLVSAVQAYQKHERSTL
ncbi:MAG: LemA family protein, partial [Verrucomicrobiales bacterium]|nr:LemA family protein [Verrucomicrobiales bacterium]